MEGIESLFEPVGVVGVDAAVVGEVLVKFGGEEKAGRLGRPLEPGDGSLLVRRAVEGAVDLDAIDEGAEVGELVHVGAGIDDALPVGIGPAGDADKDVCPGFHEAIGTGRPARVNKELDQFAVSRQTYC